MSKILDGCLILSREAAEYWEFSNRELRRIGNVDIQADGWCKTILESDLEGRKKIAVALDSDCVLAAKLVLPMRVCSNPEALVYEAEKHFPILAERMLLTSMTTSDDSTFLIVVDREWLDPILATLTGSGIEIVFIAPATLLFAQSIPKTKGQQTVEIQTSGRIEELHIGPKGIEAWTMRPDGDPNSADLSVKQFCFDERESWLKAIAQVTQNHLSRNATTWGAFDVNRNTSPEIQSWYTTAVVLLLSISLITVGLLWRGTKYQTLSSRIEEKNSELSRQLFPERKRIRSLQRELEAERDRLKAIERASEELLGQNSPVALLQDFLRVVPEAVGIDFTELRFVGDVATVSGKAERLELAAELANAFRVGGMNVDERKFGAEFEIEISSKEKKRGKIDEKRGTNEDRP